MDGNQPVRRFSLAERIKLGLISTLGRVLVWLIDSTIRYRYVNFSRLEECHRQGGVILSFWHNQIFLGTYVFRHRNIVVMTSQAFDGEYIARIIRAFGYGAARGSSSRGAIRALLEMKKTLREGGDVAFTVDGPRGPRYRVKAGPLWLAAKAKRPILCFHIQPERYWELKSWDGFRIPKPFSRAIVRMGRPLEIPSSADPADFIDVYQAEMDRLRRLCEEEFSSPEKRSRRGPARETK